MFPIGHGDRATAINDWPWTARTLPYLGEQATYDMIPWELSCVQKSSTQNIHFVAHRYDGVFLTNENKRLREITDGPKKPEQVEHSLKASPFLWGYSHPPQP